MREKRREPIEPIVCGVFSGTSMRFLTYQGVGFFSGKFSCSVSLVIVSFSVLWGAGPEGVTCEADSLKPL